MDAIVYFKYSFNYLVPKEMMIAYLQNKPT